MFDTYVTVIGNVLTAPEWRRTTQSGTLVANFKVASTARRLDRESGRWVDGNSLRVRVNCWRKLAEGVASSVMVGDPIVVVGRMYTRDWTDDAGNHRSMYELEAVAVGHDLSRGRGKFARNRATTSTSSLEDAEAEARVHGETTESVPPREAPALPDDRPFDDDSEYVGGPGVPAVGFDPARFPVDGFDGRPDLDAPHTNELTKLQGGAASTGTGSAEFGLTGAESVGAGADQLDRPGHRDGVGGVVGGRDDGGEDDDLGGGEDDDLAGEEDDDLGGGEDGDLGGGEDGDGRGAGHEPDADSAAPAVRARRGRGRVSVPV